MGFPKKFLYVSPHVSLKIRFNKIYWQVFAVKGKNEKRKEVLPLKKNFGFFLELPNDFAVSGGYIYEKQLLSGW